MAEEILTLEKDLSVKFIKSGLRAVPLGRSENTVLWGSRVP